MESFRNLVKILTTLRKPVSRPLGRWNIENCHNKIDQKIDLSNEDHCGPCGQYIMIKKGEFEDGKGK